MSSRHMSTLFEMMSP